MHASDLPESADLAPQPIPVVCDKCRQTGLLGEGPFSALRDILNFTPVKRRAHVNNWTAEHQRAFIAALAITGSPRQAARAIGRHQFGADSLRNHRFGKSFAAAWDAAMELAREREVMRIHENLATLAKERDEQLAQLSPSPRRGEGSGEGPRPIHPDCDYDPDVHTDDYPELWQAKEKLRERLINARRLYLMLIATDADKRAAWEVLVGPVDWDRAERMEPQADEPQPVRVTEENTSELTYRQRMNPHGLPNLRQPDMILPIERGLLPQLTGDYGPMDQIRADLARYEPGGDLHEEE